MKICIDIETTGLDPHKNDFWEIALLREDGKFLNLFINHQSCYYDMNTLRMFGTPLPLPEQVQCDSYREASEIIHNFIGKSSVFIGKNAGSFDLQFLKNRCPMLRWKHRCIDIGNLYLTGSDIVPPDLASCIERANQQYGSVKFVNVAAHRAWSDALVTMQLYIFKMSGPVGLDIFELLRAGLPLEQIAKRVGVPLVGRTLAGFTIPLGV